MDRTASVLLLSVGLWVIGGLTLWLATRSATGPQTNATYRTDDRFWPNGIVYKNPDDPDLFVPRRTYGWTLNFGHPKSTQFLIGIFLLVLGFVALSALPLGHGCHTFGCTP